MDNPHIRQAKELLDAAGAELFQGVDAADVMPTLLHAQVEALLAIAVELSHARDR